MRGHIALAAGIALACVSSASLAADIPTDTAVPFASPPIGERFYVSFHGGYTFGNKSHDVAYDTVPFVGGNPVLWDPLGFSPTYVTDSNSKNGWRAGAAVGKHLGDYFSLEAEISYSRADASSFAVTLPVQVAGSLTGSGSMLTGMINAFVGTNVGSIRPYIGGGAGFGYFTASNIQDPLNPSPAGPLLDGSDIGLAAQAMAGIDFAVTDTMTIGGRYRYLYVTDLSLMDGGYKHDFNLTSQSVEIVLTNKFN
jgi:opacity protein-like surface antigen